jgi:hypothetical protein
MTMVSLLFSLFLAIDERPPALLDPLETIAREFVVNFSAAKFEAASKEFNETLRAVVTPSMLADLSHQSDASLGRFHFITSVRRRRESGFSVVEIVCRYEKSLASFRVVFDDEDHIGAIHLEPIANEPVDPMLEAVARELLKNFIAGNFDAVPKQFDKNLRAELLPTRLASLQMQVTNTFGVFRSIKSVRQITDETYRTIDLTTAFERSPVSVRVAFNDAGEVTGLIIGPISTPQPARR